MTRLCQYQWDAINEEWIWPMPRPPAPPEDPEPVADARVGIPAFEWVEPVAEEPVAEEPVDPLVGTYFDC